MPRAGLTPQRLVEAAADLADSAGLDRVTISALARGFGVKDASLYSHIRSLDDLRARLAVHCAAEFADRIGSALAGRSGRSALTAFADAYRGYALAHPGRYAAVQLRLPADVVAASPGHAKLVEYTGALLRSYGLGEPDLTDAVRLLRSTFHGFAALEAADAFGAPRPVQESWSRALDALHSLLTRWPTA
ncbi:TetR/AcrR family transcriptional regulator [Streptomyces antimicrobicus]|uniref:TetR/AcrR family transcriptional regulator n=1 Tax=Streptomyces antimicrobicus TaxID=2883108 RepID=A0ABS8BAK7_9ACTN|nr:TetR-like C-terminal domain-containing protein [Streptomyces antimicrobicus]MCB5181576.1 TetR/AcrR family transcriptional regulator [Streptomyces antimicrobicus]